MKIVGLLALNSFPLWNKTFNHLNELCSSIYIRFDGINGDPEICRELYKEYKKENSKVKGVNIVNDKWYVTEWREQLLRMVDNVNLQDGDIVITLDEDETFGEGIKEEISLFRISDKKSMVFGYNSLESDHGIINKGVPYPFKKHCKIFKWSKGLSYYPYHGDGFISTQFNEKDRYYAKTKINHWCAYTKELEVMKHWRNDIMGRVKVKKEVTILGFGLSSSDSNVKGELWSMNDCYNVFDKDTMKLCTRIFEMHNLDKRSKVLTSDGQSHIERLNELGKRGHRIICQQPDPRIFNSEAYPIEEFRKQCFPLYFTGTPTYLLALAILEGYTHINVFGVDQMDWEHQLQRNSWIHWCGVALGRGIQLGGKLTYLNVFSNRLYGYSYGPEWDDECNRLQWLGFPIEIKFKEESRAIRGDLYSKGE